MGSADSIHIYICVYIHVCSVCVTKITKEEKDERMHRHRRSQNKKRGWKWGNTVRTYEIQNGCLAESGEGSQNPTNSGEPMIADGFWGKEKWMKKRKRIWLVLGMEEEKVHYRDTGEQSQRQWHLGESRMDMTRLNWAVWGGVKGRGRAGESVAAREGGVVSKVPSGWVAKMDGLYQEEHLGEGQPTPWAGEV